jgi:hypothetical protein
VARQRWVEVAIGGTQVARTAAPLGMARQDYVAAPARMARQACYQPETEVSSGFCCPLNSTHLQEINITHPFIQKPIWGHFPCWKHSFIQRAYIQTQFGTQTSHKVLKFNILRPTHAPTKSGTHSSTS